MTDTPIPDFFYYFTSVAGAERKKWVEDTIGRQLVYFKPRGVLNDPNELRPFAKLEGTRAQFLRYVRSAGEAHLRRLSPAKRAIEEQRLLRIFQSSPPDIERILHETLDGIGLYSVTSNPKEPLLWAHYADGHKGIALKFDANRGLFKVAKQVTYASDPPTVNRVLDSPEDLFFKCVLTKNMSWKYECEWRVCARWQDSGLSISSAQLASDPEIRTFLTSQHGPGHYSIPSEALTAVLVGASASEADQRWLSDCLTKYAPNVPLHRVELSRSGGIHIPDTVVT